MRGRRLGPPSTAATIVGALFALSTAIQSAAAQTQTPTPAPAAAVSAIGEWRRADGSHVQLRPCDDGLCGRIVRAPDQTRRDSANPDPKLRARPLLGIQVFTSGRRAGPDGWKGTLYVPDSGRTWDARLALDGRATLQVSICGPMGLLCATESWSRVK